jgi:hypothetical protein
MMHSLGTKAGRAKGVATFVLLALLLISVTIAGLMGCANNATTSTNSSATTTSSQGGDTTVVSQSGDSTTTSLALGSDPVYDDKLKVTALAVNALSQFLENQNVSHDDPRIGLLYGLRAQEQAITVRKALAQKVYAVSDAGMQDVYSTLSLGRSVATGAVLATLGEAYKTIENIGHPSAAPDAAATALDKFISQLEPLIAQANQMSGATAGGSSTTNST